MSHVPGRFRVSMLAIVLLHGFARIAVAEDPIADDSINMPQIEIESRRSVSVVGTADSLRALIEELCGQTGIELKSYGAPDRRVVVNYTGLPLRRVLERLLCEESYAMGFEQDQAANRARLSWLRVVGSDGAARRSATGRGRGSITLPNAAIFGSSASARTRATDSFARRLQSDDALRERFLGTPDSNLEKQLADNQYARTFLQRLRTQVRDPRVRSKFARLLTQIGR